MIVCVTYRCWFRFVTDKCGLEGVGDGFRVDTLRCALFRQVVVFPTVRIRYVRLRNTYRMNVSIHRDGINCLVDGGRPDELAYINKDWQLAAPRRKKKKLDERSRKGFAAEGH